MSLTANRELRASSDTLEILLDMAKVLPRITSATPPTATEYLRSFPILASTDPDLDAMILLVRREVGTVEVAAIREDEDKEDDDDDDDNIGGGVGGRGGERGCCGRGGRGNAGCKDTKAEEPRLGMGFGSPFPRAVSVR